VQSVGILLNADKGCDTTVRSVAIAVCTPKHKASAGRIRSYLIFALCACLYILPFMRLFYMRGTDEGTLDYGAVRVVHGQVFARDFFEVIGPGTFYWLAGFFKVFGVSFFATRICLFLSSLGTALVMYSLSRRVCGRYQILPCVLLAGTYFGGLWPAISHHVDSNFFALLAVACIVAWHDRHSKRLLLAAGALAGLTTAFLQPKGILLFCAFLIWLWILHRRRVVSISTLGIATVGYLSVIGLILLYFWSKGALSSLIYVNLVWPSQHYGEVNSVPYARGIFQNYWNHWVIAKSTFKWTVPMAAVLIIPLLFIAALPALLLALGARYKWHLARPEILIYWLCGSAIWTAELHRKEMTHLVFGSPLLVILCIHFLVEYRGRIADLALQALSISVTCLASFNLLCVLLAVHTITTRVGSVEAFQDAPALRVLMKLASPGEKIFAYPYCPRYYFLASTTNPTPFSILAYNYNTPSQFQEVVRILEQDKVRYVMWDVNFAQLTGTIFPGSQQPPSERYIIEPYLESHYRVVQVVDGTRIMERKTDEHAN
jgi:Dolichyl-phosphate-mannose-protein mannosyltransferase